MNPSVEAVASSLQALGEQYRSITHNLANVNTAGYKRRVTAFSEALDAARRQDEAQGVVGRTVIDHGQATFDKTQRALDVALDGPGFLVVETPEGPRYTRNGAMRINADRQIVDPLGRMLAGTAGPITLPPGVAPSQVQIGADGSVTAGQETLGQLRIVEFEDPAALTPIGQSCFQTEGRQRAQPAGDTRVCQGFREASNVNITEELVGLITVSRLYEANLKSIQAEDERAKTLLQVAMG